MSRNALKKANMAQIWKDRYEPRKHANKMYGSDGLGAEETRDERLIPRYVYFVRVCSLTLNSTPSRKSRLASHSTHRRFTLVRARTLALPIIGNASAGMSDYRCTCEKNQSARKSSKLLKRRLRNSRLKRGSKTF